jgi:xanthine dehydrogenase molybdenum-binding subunit
LTIIQPRVDRAGPVGTSPLRHDGVDKVTGRALYGIDASMPNMLIGKVLRSPHAHARIISIDTRRAQSMRGVHAVVTWKDLPDPGDQMLAANEQGEAPIRFKALNMIARDKVLYHGHAIAAIAAVDGQTAEEAVKRIDVLYEELPAVMDARAAMAVGAAILDPELRTRNGAAGDRLTNVALHMRVLAGDVERGFAEADVVIEREFTTSTIHQGYLEPHAATVYWRPDGHLLVETSTQAQFGVRSELAGLLQIPPSQIHVTPLEIGGGFGGKTTSWLETLAALLSRASGRPVKMVMNRAEVLLASGPAPGAYLRAKIGATNAGKITAMQVYAAVEAGAFPSSPLPRVAHCAAGLYDLNNFLIEGDEVLVNKPKTTAYRAPASPHCSFAVESVVDELCRSIGQDPLAFRLANAPKEGSLRADGSRFERIGMVECLEAAQSSAHWRSTLDRGSRPIRRGRGIAGGFWINGGGLSSVTARLNTDGTVTLLEGSPDIGGTRTSIALQFAETLGMAVADVHPIVADTDSIPTSGMTGGSRTTFATGYIAHRAALALRERVIAGLAKLWAVSHDDVRADSGLFTAGSRAATLKVAAQLLAGSGVDLSVTLSDRVPGVGPAYAVHIADVEVDEETGRTRVIRYTAVQDVGRAVYPPYVESQLQGGAAQGIGWALHEGYWYDSQGRLKNASLLDYRMPTALDLPMIETIVVEVPNPHHPYGVRGVGEVPIVPPLAAIANAIRDAVGVRVTDLPITPARLSAALAARDGTQGGATAQ